MLNGKTPAEVLIGRTVRSIFSSVLPRTTFSKLEKWDKGVTFNVCDPVLVRDFRKAISGLQAPSYSVVEVLYLKKTDEKRTMEL